jgi:hypothetical protein
LIFAPNSLNKLHQGPWCEPNHEGWKNNRNPGSSDASNEYRLSLVPLQLIIGSANQRHPSHRQRLFSAENSIETGKKKHQWKQEQ